MTLDRRELLTTFLGLPLAAGLGGCSSGSRPPLPLGEIVGASHGLGHRLRGGERPTVDEGEWTSCRVLIVGGGVAGLSAARRLKRAGIDDLRLLELEETIGGTSRSGRSTVVGYPWGAHYVPAPTSENPDLVELFDELGAFEGLDERGDPIVAEPLRCRDPQERLFYKGEWYEGLFPHAGASEDDRRQLAKFRAKADEWVEWRDGRGRRAFTIPVSRCSDDAFVTELDRITMAEWLEREGLDSPRLRWYVDLACRDDYGMQVHQTSAWAGLFYFAARKPTAGEDSRPFVTWPEGNGRIVRHVREAVRGHVETGWVVVDLNPVEADGASRVEAVAVADDGRVRGVRADRVVFAAPQFLVPHVVRPLRDDPPTGLRDFEYGAWLVANLHLAEHPDEPGFARAWDNVLHDSPSLGYVSATHQAGADHGPTVLTYYLPFAVDDNRAARERLLATDRDAWAEVVLSDLERAHPDLRSKCERLDVMRWGHAMIQPRPGFVWGPSRRRAAEPFRGIHFAHSDLSGVALFEEAFDQGTRAADEVLASLA